MLTVSEDYVRSDTLTGADFTLRVKLEPYLDHTSDVSSIYWHWAENILAQEPYNLKDSRSEKIDLNQNYLVNVSRGLDKYGWISEYKAVIKMLHEQKKLGR